MNKQQFIQEFILSYIASTKYSKIKDLSNVSVEEQFNLNIIQSNLQLAINKISERFKIYTKEVTIPFGTTTFSLPIDFLEIAAIRFTDGTTINVGSDNLIYESSFYEKNSLSAPFSSHTKSISGLNNFGVAINEPFILSFYGTYPQEFSDQSVQLKYTRINTDVITGKELNEMYKFPLQYTSAIYNYSAYLIYQSVNPGIDASNNAFYMRYEAECRRLEANTNTGISQGYDSTVSIINSGLINGL